MTMVTPIKKAFNCGALIIVQRFCSLSWQEALEREPRVLHLDLQAAGRDSDNGPGLSF